MRERGPERRWREDRDLVLDAPNSVTLSLSLQDPGRSFLIVIGGSLDPHPVPDVSDVHVSLRSSLS